MKANKLTYLLVFALALTAATGCKKPTPLTPIPKSVFKVGDERPEGLPKGNPYDPSRDPSITEPTALPDIGDISKYHQDRTALQSHTIHFDYDSAVVKSGDGANIAAVAGYLGNNTGIALLIEGHCDERGTEEYNRSLGSRRAAAARDAVIAAGGDASRITVTTFGEDKPAVTGHDESAWSQNRRAEFIVLTPK